MKYTYTDNKLISNRTNKEVAKSGSKYRITNNGKEIRISKEDIIKGVCKDIIKTQTVIKEATKPSTPKPSTPKQVKYVFETTDELIDALKELVLVDTKLDIANNLIKNSLSASDTIIYNTYYNQCTKEVADSQIYNSVQMNIGYRKVLNYGIKLLMEAK